MKIDDYDFGRIVIDGKTYTSDVIVYPERLDTSWWRKEGHLLQPEDITEVLDAEPEVLIIGTGYSGCMRVPRPLSMFLEKGKYSKIKICQRCHSSKERTEGIISRDPLRVSLMR